MGGIFGYGLVGGGDLVGSGSGVFCVVGEMCCDYGDWMGDVVNDNKGENDVEDDVGDVE